MIMKIMLDEGAFMPTRAHKADAGLDIGSTLIGMHLKHVAVPLRLSSNRIGEAYVTAAYTRPKYIGGPRANYI